MPHSLPTAVQSARLPPGFLQFCPRKVRKSGLGTRGCRGTPLQWPPAAPWRLLGAACLPPAKKRTRDEGRKSALRSRFQVLLTVPHAFTPWESRVSVRTRVRVLLQNLGTKCLNSDTLGTNRSGFQALSDVNRCKRALRARVLIVVYGRNVPYMAPGPQERRPEGAALRGYRPQSGASATLRPAIPGVSDPLSLEEASNWSIYGSIWASKPPKLIKNDQFTDLPPNGVLLDRAKVSFTGGPQVLQQATRGSAAWGPPGSPGG